MKHKRLIALLLGLLVATLAMGGLASAEEVEKTTIAADDSHMYLAVGKGDALKLTIEPRAAHRKGVTYAISDESIATVDKRGNVKGVALGECTLTITSVYDPTVTLDVPVSIVRQVKKLTAAVDKDTIHVGETAQITCGYEPEDADLHQATYVSANEKIATVDENGVVTGHAKGRVDINVRSLDGYARARVRVTVRQQPTEISLSPEDLTIAVGKTATLKATVLPKDANDKSVVWSSSDESVATVDQRGRVKSLALGSVTITATSVDDPSVSGSVEVKEVMLAKSLSFSEKTYPVIIGQTAPTTVIVDPADTSDKSVTYKVKHPKIATIDENGVITGVKGGKTTVTATTNDGSRKRATATIEVVVPVTGVTYKHSDVRVGAGSTGRFRAEIVPKDATDKRMTWVSSDESIAIVKGTSDSFSIRGKKWGRCTVTGTTEDGGYSLTLNVNIGSLRHAAVIRQLEIREGKPYITLQNKSNMVITNIHYQITGTDALFNPVRMSTKGETLHGDYLHELQPMEKTRHGRFTFYHHSDYPGLMAINMAITGWECKDGYYDSNGQLQYSYTVPEKNREWVSWSDPSVTY